MLIEQIGATQTREQALKLKKEPQSPPSPRGEDKDAYESSPDQRAALLKSIKTKVKSGFYNKDSVIDDLSHSLAQALDQTC